MEKNTLRKRRFLCFDLTPRWKMWKRIEDLEVRLATCLCERNEADGRLIEREHEVLALTQARDTLYKRIDELEGRLRKFDRTRGKAANTSKAMKHDPQNKILAYLKAGGRLTVRKAERLYHTTELRRIISRLRKMGYSICSNKQKAVTEDGRPTQFNEYYMPQVADSCQ